MAYSIKRLHYFDHQFLRERDFTDEQAYHLERRRMHNELLHTWGIARGLELSAVAGGTHATINAGVAIDGQGREIILGTDTETQDVSGLAGKTVFVTIAYDEQESDATSETGAAGNTRWTEAPVFPQLSESPPADPSLQLILGRIIVSATGTVTSTDTGTGANTRRTAGVVAGDLAVRSLTLTDPNVVSTQHPRMTIAGASQSNLTGSLSVEGNLTAGGALFITGAISTKGLFSVGASVGIGTTNPASPLHITGPALVPPAALSGAQNGLLIGLQNTSGYKWIQSYGGALALNPIGNNVGIGNANPGSNLHVNVPASGTPVSAMTIDVQSYQNLANAIASHSLRIRDVGAGVTHFFVRGDGNVGVGTPAPSARLSVVAGGAAEIAGTAQSLALRVSAGTLGTAVGSELSLGGIGFISPAPNNVSLGIRAMRVAAGNDWKTAAIGLGIDVDDTVRAGGTGLWLHPNGNLGFGITTPLYRGHFVAPGGFGPEDPTGVSQAGNVPLVVQCNSTAFGILNAAGRQAFALNIDGTSNAANARGIPTFFDKYDGNWRPSIYLQNGNVGIGTVPGFKLDVADRMRVRQGANSAGIWFFQTGPNADRAFVGMANDNQVGFWGSIMGNWGLLMDTTNGNVGIGAVNAGVKLNVAGNFAAVVGSGNEQAYIGGDGAGNDVQIGSLNASVSNIAFWSVPNGTYMTIVAKNVSPSDETLKSNIVPIGRNLEKLRQIRGVSFEWANTSAPTVQAAEEREIGVIAQEVEKVYPGLVTVLERDKIRAVNYNGLTAVLIEAVKELDAKLDALSQRLDALESPASPSVGVSAQDEPKDEPAPGEIVAEREESKKSSSKKTKK